MSNFAPVSVRLPTALSKVRSINAVKSRSALDRERRRERERAEEERGRLREELEAFTRSFERPGPPGGGWERRGHQGGRENWGRGKVPGD